MFLNIKVGVASTPLKGGAKRLKTGAKRLKTGAKRLKTGVKRLDKLKRLEDYGNVLYSL